MKIYNSLTREKKTFEPLKKGRVGMYVCGPTVYDEPHIGHARAAYIFEVIRNYFEFRGYRVKFVQNITDVDDKIIAKAKQELADMPIDSAVKKIGQKYTQRYYQDMDAIGIRRANHSPKATAHIKEMKNYISGLIKKNFAYQAGGDVYFAVRRFKDYGRLSHQDLDQMRNSVRIEKEPNKNKKDDLDFALWKKAKAGEPCWPSPWGKGRPGWHIECSVMSSKYLGEEFDIHGGGQDLIFPHHENEIAQSRCYSAKRFAHYWMHNGLLTINGQKMAKSLGNFVSVKDFLKTNSADVLKLFFLSAHYRSPIDFNQERIQEASKSYERFQIVLAKLSRKLKTSKSKSKTLDPDLLKFKQRFSEAMDDDFNTPQALAGLFDLVSFINRLMLNVQLKQPKQLASAAELLQDCLQVLGIDLRSMSQKGILAAQIKTLIKTREQLRKSKKFAEADKVRKELETQGVILEDTKDGKTEWRRRI